MRYPYEVRRVEVVQRGGDRGVGSSSSERDRSTESLFSVVDGDCITPFVQPVPIRNIY